MFTSSKINQEIYSEQMKLLKQLNREYIELKGSREYILGRKITLLKDTLMEGDFIKLKKYLHKNQILKKAADIQNKKIILSEQEKMNTVSNYFNNNRIAVYTCIIGSYDEIREPVCRPDNCDFFMITDVDRKLKDSVWQQIMTEDYSEALKKLNNAEINRYFKMHPEEVFGKYRFSIYIDGNIRVITDLTEMVNKIGTCGVAVHVHGKRNCIYDEMEAILALGKETKENLERHIRYLKETGFPKDYGLAECCVIAREHNMDLCKKIMSDWWNDFLTYSKRDQISFPAVLFRNGITVREIAVLGTVKNDYAIRVEGHI